MSLNRLPPDVLNLISNHLPGGSILDLWKAGNRSLHYVMMNGGVTDVRLRDGTFASTSRFPRALRFFRHLKSLSIDRGDQPLDHISNIRIGLQSLSPTLEKVSLSFRDAEAVFLEDPTLFVRNIFEEKVEQDDAHSKDTGRLWDIEKYWPNLNFLELNPHSVPGCLQDSDLASLPLTLTELRLLALDSERTEGMTAMLNRNLLKVTLHFEATKETLLALPPHLESFQYLGSFHASALKFLPASLTHIDASIWELSGETIQDIPIILKSIHFNIESHENPDVKIPSHIEDLSLSGETTNWLYRSGFLPSSLLSLYGGQVSTFPIKAPWPASLTSMAFHDRVKWPQEAEVTFPPKLLTLVLTPHFTGPDPQIELDLLLKSLPKSIQTLRLAPQSLHRLNFSNLPLLPSLKCFTIHGDFVHSQALYEKLPAQLEHFEAAPKDEQEFVGETWFSLLPPSLTSLRLVNFPCIPTKALFTLPTKLTSLILSLKGHLTAEHFHSLPRSLTCLRLPASEIIEFNAIAELPITLRILEIRHTGSKFDISSLPPSLKTFILTRCSMDLSRDLINSIPRSLVSFRVDSAKLMPGAAEAEWPPQLRFIKLSNLKTLPEHIKNFRKAFLNGNFITPDSRVLQRFNHFPESSN